MQQSAGRLGCVYAAFFRRFADLQLRVAFGTGRGTAAGGRGSASEHVIAWVIIQLAKQFATVSDKKSQFHSDVEN